VESFVVTGKRVIFLLNSETSVIAEDVSVTPSAIELVLDRAYVCSLGATDCRVLVSISLGTLLHFMQHVMLGIVDVAWLGNR
jgi:hypothetical protein